MSKYKHCVIINVDGCRRDLLYELIDDGKMPNTAEIFSNGVRFADADTVFPTLTFPTQAAGVTGNLPNRHGIPINLWFDRFDGEGKLHDYITHPVQAFRVHGYNPFTNPLHAFKPPGEPGLSDAHLLPGIKTIYEAAGEGGVTSVTSFHFFGKGATVRVPPTPFDIAVYAFSYLFKSWFVRFDDAMIRGVEKNVRESGVPGIAFYYFPSSDTVTHNFGEKGQRWYLESLFDKGLGKIISLYREMKAIDDTVFILYADHGHHEIPRRVSALLNMSWAKNILTGLKGYEKAADGKDYVLSLQGGMTGIYLKCRKTGKWAQLPRAEQTAEMAENYLKKGAGELTAAAYRDEDGFKFVEGPNPMGLDLDWALPLLNAEFFGPSAPDVLIFPNYTEGYNFWLRPVASIHGNITKTERAIPLLFGGRGLEKETRKDKASILDVVPTAANLLDFPFTTGDGKVLKI